MASVAPVSGRCGAKLRGKETYCERHPVRGEKRCRIHGSGSKANPGGRPVVTGKYSQRFKREAEPTQAKIDALLLDPDLLEARRPVAIQAVLIEEIGLIPANDVVVELARQSIPHAVRKAYFDKHGEEIEPTEAQMEVARRRYLKHSMDAAEIFQRSVSAGAKQVQMGEMLGSELMPFFEDMAAQIRRLVDRYVPEEHQEEFIEAFRRSARHVIVRAATIGS